MARIPIVRSGGADGEVSVMWRTKDKSAVGGKDYIGGEGTITFKHTEVSKFILVCKNNYNLHHDFFYKLFKFKNFRPKESWRSRLLMTWSLKKTSTLRWNSLTRQEEQNWVPFLAWPSPSQTTTVRYIFANYFTHILIRLISYSVQQHHRPLDEDDARQPGPNEDAPGHLGQPDEGRDERQRRRPGERQQHGLRHALPHLWLESEY